MGKSVCINSSKGCTNPAVNGCQQCSLITGSDVVYCSACWETVHSSSVVFQSHKCIPLMKGSSNSWTPLVKSCPIHKDNNLGLYCCTCEMLVCTACPFAKEHRSHTHTCIPLEEQSQKRKQQLGKGCEKVQSEAEAVKTSHEQFEKSLNRVFDSLKAALEQRRETLRHMSEQVRDKKLASLKLQEDTLTKASAGVVELKRLAEDSISQPTPFATLFTSQGIWELLGSLSVSAEALKPCTDTSDIIANSSTGIETACKAVSNVGFFCPHLHVDSATSVPTTGGMTTISGSFASSSSSISVRIAGKMCSRVMLEPSGSKLLCSVPPGVGANLQIEVKLDETYKATANRFSYMSPDILSVICYETVAISGLNFGNDRASVQVEIGGVPCENIWVNDHITITWTNS
eukprot:TRINITY_DN2244_c0_g1_i2.p1 TRINITY_DN2244_c0_g1~~TRINITY_DN2244_c0_g1_i2.p1  ORF type:complete len:424 (+),score=86.26 TRINITY_DN2244_c0_g1_i2:67-1272(+)